MNNYEKPTAEFIVFETEDIMQLSLNASNDAAHEDRIDISDLL